jgi:hypothetical protein
VRLDVDMKEVDASAEIDEVLGAGIGKFSSSSSSL